jgi:hypothetical protein
MAESFPIAVDFTLRRSSDSQLATTGGVRQRAGFVAGVADTAMLLNTPEWGASPVSISVNVKPSHTCAPFENSPCSKGIDDDVGARAYRK